MKSILLPLLACPACHGAFRLIADSRDGHEILEGGLVCEGCASTFPIVRGIPRFLHRNITAEQKATADAFGYEWTHYLLREFLECFRSAGCTYGLLP